MLISCGQDHSIKIWDLKDIQKWIDESYHISSDDEESRKKKETKMVQFPVSSKHKIHSNYVDDVCWFEDLVFSKSTESMIKIWIPPLDDFEKSIKTVGELRYEDGGESFIRFDVDYGHRLIACGDRKGSVYVFELDRYFSANEEDLGGDGQGDADTENENDEQWHMMLAPKFVSKYKPIKLKLDGCDAPVRCVRFNRLGDLVAVTDDGTIYRFRRSAGKTQREVFQNCKVIFQEVIMVVLSQQQGNTGGLTEVCRYSAVATSEKLKLLPVYNIS